MNLPDRFRFFVAATILALGACVAHGATEVLPGTQPLVGERDLSDEMIAGMTRFLDRELAASVDQRGGKWHPDFSSRANYEKSVTPNRDRFARVIGVIDSRVAGSEPEFVATVSRPAMLLETNRFTAYAVRWPVLPGVYGEGLLLQPKGEATARVVAIPDADQAPEVIAGIGGSLPPALQFARRLAEGGCQVVVPTLISREPVFSGNAALKLHTNQPHREWIYRQAYTFGRHVIGYEVQKILAAVDWFNRQNSTRRAPIGVVGWGEGGLLAFYSAALDPRIDAVVVSGYFDRREAIWAEPIYRNLFGLLREFGDAEIASLIVPRILFVEPSTFPNVGGPPAPPAGSGRVRASAAPGRIATPSLASVSGEVERAKRRAGSFASSIHVVTGREPLAETTLNQFLGQLRPGAAPIPPPGAIPESPAGPDSLVRQRRQVEELERYTQQLIEVSREVRDRDFWKKNPPVAAGAWSATMQPYRDRLWGEVIGRLPAGQAGLNPRSRKFADNASWTGYEVTLDVLPDMIVWGYLLLPNDLKPGERRPVIVAHHGGGGLPGVVVDRSSRTYKGFAAQLADRGYVVFAPHFPWRAGDRYRELQRKANPLGLSVFSFILADHERLLDWLTAQPWADPKRIGLYGLSWGGKVAVRVPALLERYALAIPSGDFNEWIWKNASTAYSNSYMFAPEYEMFDFNLGMTFGYAEMAAMIAPRPFMVERGHDDGVGIDEWVAFEYAKVYRHYDKLKIPEKSRIEYFRGIHEIHAVGTFEFIEEHFGRAKATVAGRP
ncbi:MAG: dienelactone hydrolase family protein [Verrucomicrobia bacterium]|nr:dienelactone hydrolase family protein [Verrucomicrobiota bacterium]